MTRVPATATRRRYDNTLRREKAGQTAFRIVDAATELLRESSIRHWGALTIRGVAERAGVNERTVFRHFPNERALRDAVMMRLEEQAGVNLANLRLDGIPDAALRIFSHVSSYPPESRPPLDPTLADASRRQHQALLAAVGEAAPQWPESDRKLVAAMFDVLWGIASYERLMVDWQFDHDEAARAITWTIGLLQQAVLNGTPPTPANKLHRS
ncbi:MAG TPA: helix-turn-helix domain-containing protein [Acidimicrobiales bacterium]